MCGFVGFRGRDKLSENTLSTMANAIRHRGPDDSGVWLDTEVSIGLAHRRLSIVDLSPAGNQPMKSSSGRFILVFNGEIYNHQKIKKELEKEQDICWRGHSDTEILVEAIEAWGAKKTLNNCSGMFAFALWDRQQRSLLLARDRMGEKPLYYGWRGCGTNSVFMFGSELKAFKASPHERLEVDKASLALYSKYSYVPSPHSIYRNIFKLPPGHFLQFNESDYQQILLPNPVEYWSLRNIAQSNTQRDYCSDMEAIDELEAKLVNSVSEQMIADVPIGAFLSGGVDSSTVVAIMQSISVKPIKTFSIGFQEDQYDEAKYAKSVAEHLKTDHHELYVTCADAISVLPLLPSIYDEPFADSSQIPTLLVSKFAREKVTVSLSGDAGDELFAGYNRYLFGADLWKKLDKYPRFLRRLISHFLNALPTSSFERLGSLSRRGPSQYSNFIEKVQKLASVLGSRDINEVYQSIIRTWGNEEKLVLGAEEVATSHSTLWNQLSSLDPVQRMMVIDSLTYLPDDILVKLDRATMGVSLESRVPFLNHQLIEFAWSLPQNIKLRNGVSKWILRQVLYRHVPKELIERPKMGFGVPIDSWLRGPLRDWAETLLDQSRLEQEGNFNHKIVRQCWVDHVSGRSNNQHQLWNVLMFQSWLEAQSKLENVYSFESLRLAASTPLLVREQSV